MKEGIRGSIDHKLEASPHHVIQLTCLSLIHPQITLLLQQIHNYNEDIAYPGFIDHTVVFGKGNKMDSLISVREFNPGGRCTYWKWINVLITLVAEIPRR